MIVDKTIDELLKTVAGLKPGNSLDRFIGKAVFPNFKNLEPKTEIEFEFPITALVGANGTGKSSILHALWGMPRRYSTSRFWFSTAIDPIVEGGKFGVQRYYYTHWVSELKRYVQTRKVRGTKRNGYWESARALESDGMEPMPPLTADHGEFRTAERWNATDRKVIYINSKCEFSAFDRFFYFPERGESLEQRQARFLSGAKRLSRVFLWQLRDYAPGGKKAVFANRDLTQEEIGWVSYILGKNYGSARFIQHRLYGGLEAPSVIFQRDDLSYSEAFAGSGELATVRIVIELLGAEKYSLVLLDEPETSLHPGAQERLLSFILQNIIKKHLQVVMSTHSPVLVNLLPTEAIRVLEEGTSGRNAVIKASHPQVAFNRLGFKPGTQVVVAVEDVLLRSLAEIAARNLDKGEQEAISFYVPPAGATSILMNDIATWVSEKRDIFVILDGDQKPIVELPDPDTIPLAEQKTLADRIFKTYKVKPLHVSNGEYKAAYEWLKWVQKRVRYLSAVCPEMVLLESLIGVDAAHQTATTNKDAKKALYAELEARGHQASTEAISVATTYIINENGKGNKHIEALTNTLKEFLSLHASQRP